MLLNLKKIMYAVVSDSQYSLPYFRYSPLPLWTNDDVRHVKIWDKWHCTTSKPSLSRWWKWGHLWWWTFPWKFRRPSGGPGGSPDDDGECKDYGKEESEDGNDDSMSGNPVGGLYDSLDPRNNCSPKGSLVLHVPWSQFYETPCHVFDLCKRCKCSKFHLP